MNGCEVHGASLSLRMNKLKDSKKQCVSRETLYFSSLCEHERDPALSSKYRYFLKTFIILSYTCLFSHTSVFFSNLFQVCALPKLAKPASISQNAIQPKRPDKKSISLPTISSRPSFPPSPQSMCCPLHLHPLSLHPPP